MTDRAQQDLDLTQAMVPPGETWRATIFRPEGKYLYSVTSDVVELIKFTPNEVVGVNVSTVIVDEWVSDT